MSDDYLSDSARSAWALVEIADSLRAMVAELQYARRGGGWPMDGARVKILPGAPYTGSYNDPRHTTGTEPCEVRGRVREGMPDRNGDVVVFGDDGRVYSTHWLYLEGLPS